MLAVALERDVLEQHDLVVAADLLEHPAQMARRILLVALAVFLPRARDALRRVAQTFAFRIVAGPADQGADAFLHPPGHARLAARIVLVGPGEATHRPARSLRAAPLASLRGTRQ